MNNFARSLIAVAALLVCAPANSASLTRETGSTALTDQAASRAESPTEFSSRHRHWRHRGWQRGHHYGWRHRHHRHHAYHRRGW